MSPAKPSRPTAPRRGALLGRGLALAGYIFVVLYLRNFEVFSADFSTTGSRLLAFNLARIAFLFYFVWFLTAAGCLTLLGLERRGWALRLSREDRFLLGFIIGASEVTIGMFVLGFLNLYYPIIALALSVPILAVSYPQLALHVSGLPGRISGYFRHGPDRPWERLLTGLLSLALAALAVGLLLTRVLYPGEASNDVYEHYWPFQKAVISSHGIWPNDVWYDFYAAKGLGLMFFARLLSDELAAQAVTFCLLLAGTMAAYSVAKKACRSGPWGLLAGFSALACFLFSNPDWGAFQSHHVGAAFWLSAVAWMTVLTFDRTPTELRGWFSLWTMVTAAQAIFSPAFMIFVAPLFLVLAGGYRLRRQPAARGYFVLALGAIGATAAVLLVNYAVSGMPLENPWRFMWSLADQTRFSRWCSPYLPTYFNEGSGQTLGSVSLLALLQSGRTWADWMTLLRGSELAGLLLAWPVLLALPLVIVGANVVKRDWVRVDRRRALPLLLALIIAVGIADIPGSPQSVYRNYAFMPLYLAPLLVIGWKLVADWMPLGRMRPMLVSALILVSGGRSAVSAWHRMYAQRSAAGHTRWPNFVSFATGKISLEEALIRGDGLWPVAQAAKAAIGIDRELFCFNRWISCEGSFAFPGSGLLTEPSRTSFGGQWHVIAFDEAAPARAALEREKINYFLMDLNVPIFGCIFYSPLFDPAHLAERFDLAWSEGSACVITWHKAGGRPLPADLVAAWQRRVGVDARNPGLPRDLVFKNLYRNMEAIYNFNRGKGYPLQRPPGLARTPGWQ